ncbi:MAG: hypothetical protein QOF09_4795 [Alphaproteobacteria bacterium]|jgi:tripartite-type tricarboxylate transporter receptor subunit TctC|nr:hypothetical protein [Alphaproteobacteria bacterium]
MTAAAVAAFASRLALLAIAAVLAPLTLQAQTYPSQPIRLIVPFGAAGSPNTIARLVAEKLADDIGKPVVVENKAGASGKIAASEVAHASPDGHTLMLASEGVYAVVPAFYSDLNYDPKAGFAPIIHVARGDMFLVVNSKLGVNSLAEFIALAKSQPGIINYGTPGIATIHHLGMAHLQALAGLSLMHVPYRGLVQGTPALLANEVSVMFAALPSIAQYVEDGRLKILAVASLQRAARLPQVPTIAELGFPGFQIPTNVGFLAPAGTPKPIIEQLNKTISAGLTTPKVSNLMNATGYATVGGAPEVFDRQIREDQDVYTNLVRETGVKPQ